MMNAVRFCARCFAVLGASERSWCRDCRAKDSRIKRRSAYIVGQLAEAA